MRSSLAILSILATTALADDVVSFIFPGGYEGADPVATITTVNPTLTGMRIACPTGADSNDCGWGNGADVSIIDKTKYQATMTGDSFDMHFNCDLDTKATKMVCAAELNGGGLTTGTLSGTDVAFVSASVVEGAKLLSGPATAAASTSASASQAAKSTDAAASTGLKTSASHSASGTAGAANSASATSSGAVAENTGAAARFGIEGSALLALAGAAALNAW